MKGILCILAIVVMFTGCCKNPGVFAKIQKSEQMVQQAYYTASGQMEGISTDQYVALGGMAADLSLALASQLQQQWCPSEKEVEALEKQVKSLPLVQGK